jgi:hypothetical protein
LAQGGSELALLDDEPPLPVLPPELLEPPLDVVSPPLAPAEALLLDPPSLLEAALDELPAELEPPLLEARLELPELPPLEDDPPAWLLDPPLPAPLELELEDDEPPEDDSPELLEPGHPPRRAQQRIKARQAWVRMGTSKV